MDLEDLLSKKEIKCLWHHFEGWGCSLFPSSVTILLISIVLSCHRSSQLLSLGTCEKLCENSSSCTLVICLFFCIYLISLNTTPHFPCLRTVGKEFWIGVTMSIVTIFIIWSWLHCQILWYMEVKEFHWEKESHAYFPTSAYRGDYSSTTKENWWIGRCRNVSSLLSL